MNIRKVGLALAAILLGGQAAPPPFADAVTAGNEALGKGRYLAARDAFAKAAFDASGKSRDEGAFQSWLQFSPMLTNELPLDAMSRRGAVSPPDQVAARQVGSATARDAIDEIVARGRDTRIVILNEAHYSPRDRAFAWRVAEALRPLGYTYLAAETFNNAYEGGPNGAERLVRDGFVRLNTGAYTNDPVFASYLRQAVALGYRPVCYEITEAQRAKGTDVATREAAQTANLMAAIFNRDPASKVFIHVGHSHVTEAPLRGGRGTATEWKATRLKRATGVDPLTIDQTWLTDLSPSMRAAYPIAAAKVGNKDGVLFANGRPLVLGQYAGAVDLQVVHPARAYRFGRPTWLAALGGRPTPVPVALLPTKGEQLVQAFAAEAPADAVPLDQVLVTAGRPAPSLMLPKGVKVRFAVQP